MEFFVKDIYVVSKKIMARNGHKKAIFMHQTLEVHKVHGVRRPHRPLEQVNWSAGKADKNIKI
jgi:hypothetical protein